MTRKDAKPRFLLYHYSKFIDCSWNTAAGFVANVGGAPVKSKCQVYSYFQKFGEVLLFLYVVTSVFFFFLPKNHMRKNPNEIVIQKRWICLTAWFPRSSKKL